MERIAVDEPPSLPWLIRVGQGDRQSAQAAANSQEKRDAVRGHGPRGKALHHSTQPNPCGPSLKKSVGRVLSPNGQVKVGARGPPALPKLISSTSSQRRLMNLSGEKPRPFPDDVANVFIAHRITRHEYIHKQRRSGTEQERTAKAKTNVGRPSVLSSANCEISVPCASCYSKRDRGTNFLPDRLILLQVNDRASGPVCCIVGYVRLTENA